MQRMLISVDRDESRAAVVDDGQLTHLEIEPVGHDSCKGNIYRAIVARVEPSLQSAFIDFGRTKQGFLPVGEIHRRLRKESHDKRTPIQDILRAGQELLVQVVRDEIGNKGATLSTYVSLPGRYLVLMPQSDKSGVSRKLSDSARARVKELTESMNVPEGFGLIVRTSGESATKMQLTRDLVYLNRLWKHIDKEYAAGKGPGALYTERSLPIRFVRDYFTKDIDELVIDDEATANEIGAYLKLLMPRTLKVVERYSGAMPLFARYGLLGQVESVFARQVPLAGGGSIVIDQTEALVAIDVNSGRVKGRDIEETARATNIEAAREIARQLVLRDLGGLVVCDFIDMRDRKAVREVEATIKSAMKKDKARHKIGRISEFGLLELSRQRLKSAVHRSAFVNCEHCSGTGKYRTVESLTSSIIRRIYELITQRPVRHVIAMVPPDAANYLLNHRRLELAAVENEYNIGIEIIPMEGMTAANVMLEHFEEAPKRGGTERLQEHRLRRVTQHLDLVRNRMLKREDHDVERRLRQTKAAAMVDWNAVYKDVEQQTEGVDDTEPVHRPRGRRRPDSQRHGGQRRDGQRHGAEHGDNTEAAQASAPPAAAQVAAQTETEYPALPQPGAGFTGWIKSLFGLGSGPVRPSEPSAVGSEPARPASPSAPGADAAPRSAADSSVRPASDAAAPAQRDGARVGSELTEDDDEQPRRRRRRGRSRGSRRSAREESSDDQQAAAEDAEAAKADEDGELKPRKRRRRRRRRRPDDEGRAHEQTEEQTDAVQTQPAAPSPERSDDGRPVDSVAAEADERGEDRGASVTAQSDGSARGDASSSASDEQDGAVANELAGDPAAIEVANDNDASAPPPIPSAADEDGSNVDDEASELADVTSLARQEIERLQRASGAAGLAASAQGEPDSKQSLGSPDNGAPVERDSGDGEQADDSDAVKAEQIVAPPVKHSPFVVDLRTNSNS